MSQATIRLLKAMGEANRLRVLYLCRTAHLTLNDLSTILDVSLSGLTFHMSKLETANLITRSKERTKVFYRLTQDPKVRRLIDAVLDLEGANEALFEADMRSLNKLLETRSEQASALLKSYQAQWNQDRGLFADEAAAEALIVKHMRAKDAGRFLDVGTGTGRLLTAVAAVVTEGIGVDISHDMLAIARDAIAKGQYENLTVLYANLFKMPFLAESFDTVALYQVLHFAEDPMAAIVACTRMIKPGGELIVADFLPHEEESLKERYHHQCLGFEADEVCRWFAELGLTYSQPQIIEGRALQVGVWAATKPL